MNRDLGLAARHLTISTVGVVPGIRKLATKPLQVNLAVSLHAANDAFRDQLVPLNRRYPIAMLMQACGEYRATTGRRISFEWACIDGVNDGPSDASELAALARPLGAHVNLIPLNPTPGGLSRGLAGSPRARIVSLRAGLRDAGVNTTIRQNRGRPSRPRVASWLPAACPSACRLGRPRAWPPNGWIVRHETELRRERLTNGNERGSDPRRSERKRATRETEVVVTLRLDGTGQSVAATGLPFFDHMLAQLGRHGGMDLDVKAQGDLEVDAHHTVEDTGIVLGEAFGEALGSKVGIRRFASIAVPLDEALVEVALDLSGRPYLHYDVDWRRPGHWAPRPSSLNSLKSSGARSSIRRRSRCISSFVEGNPHHILEASFKAVARAMRVRRAGRGERHPLDQGPAVATRDRCPRLRHREPSLGGEGAATRRCRRRVSSTARKLPPAPPASCCRASEPSAPAPGASGLGTRRDRAALRRRRTSFLWDLRRSAAPFRKVGGGSRYSRTRPVAGNGPGDAGDRAQTADAMEHRPPTGRPPLASAG